MHVDFNVAFHIVPMSNFADVFLTRTVGAQRGEYSTEEPNLDIKVLALQFPLAL
jgi:hypothetical protein